MASYMVASEQYRIVYYILRGAHKRELSLMEN